MSQWTHQSNYTINTTTQDSIIMNTRTSLALAGADITNRIYSPVADELWWNGSQIITGTIGVNTLRAVGIFTGTDINSIYTIQSTVSNGVIFREDTGGLVTEQLRISKTNLVTAPILSFSGDTNTGIYHIGADNLGIACNALNIFDISPANIDIGIEATTARAINIGNTTGATGISLNAGTGGVDINAIGGGAITLSATLASSFTTTAGTLTISGQGTGITITTPAKIDIDGDIIEIDATDGVSIDAVTASNFTVTSPALTPASLTLEVAGGGAQSVIINSAGTVTNAVDINATAGGVAINGILSSNFTVTGSARDITMEALGGGGQSVIINSEGTGSSAIDINATAGGIDIDALNNIAIDTSAGGISLDSVLTSNFSLIANDGADQTLFFLATNAGVGTAHIDILAAGNISIDSTDSSNFTVITGNLSLGATTGELLLSGGSGIVNNNLTSINVDDATNATPTNVLNLQHTTTGVPGVGIGTGMTFTTEITAGNVIGSEIDSVATSIGAGTEEFDIVFNSRAAGSLVEKMRIQGRPAGTASNPTLCFDTDLDTGIYSPGANQLGFTANGFLKVGISTSHLSVVGGTALIPGINFGVTGSDTNTGMFRVAADVIGFAAAGVEKASIYSVDTGNFIEGLNVGLAGGGAVTAGIRRLSGTVANSWEDGNMGNSGQLVFSPSDFIVANPTAGSVPALTTDFINIACDAVSWTNGSGGRYGNPQLVTNSTGIGFVSLAATKLIPKGFTVTADDTLTIHSPSNTTNIFVSVGIRTIDDVGQKGNAFVSSSYVFNNTIALADLGAGVTGTNLGTGETMIILYIAPGVNLTGTGGIWGATITMSRI